MSHRRRSRTALRHAADRARQGPSPPSRRQQNFQMSFDSGRCRRAARTIVAGEKTLLDVLYPVSEAMLNGTPLAGPMRAKAQRWADSDEEHAGHCADAPPFSASGRSAIWTRAPPARASCCRPSADRLRQARHDEQERNVGIVIVSHSPLVARGAADMVRQMVGDSVPLAWCGGNADGGSRHQYKGHPEGWKRPGRRPAWRFSSISAARRPIAKWQSR